MIERNKSKDGNANKSKSKPAPAESKPAPAESKPAPAESKAEDKGKRAPVSQDRAVFVDSRGRPLAGMRPDDVRDKTKPATALAFQQACRAAIAGLQHAVSCIETASKAVSADGGAKVSNARVWATLPNLGSYAWSNGESILREVERFDADRKRAEKRAMKAAETERALRGKLEAINSKREAAGKAPLSMEDIRDMFSA